MKARHRLLAPIAAGLLLAGPALASTISGPLKLADLVALNGSGATYGPPTAAHFTEPGPITVASGAATDLLAGNKPGRAGVSELLFTVAVDSSKLSSLGDLSFQLVGVGTVSFAAADFYKASDAGFPSNIPGIGNGEVNGVKFPSAVVAGARVSLDGLADAGTDSDIGDVVVKTPVNARVDIFGLGSAVPTVAKAKKAGGATLVQDEPVLRIVSNTPNSGALGVTPGGPSPSVPEPSAALVFGAGLVVVASRLRSTSKR